MNELTQLPQQLRNQEGTSQSPHFQADRAQVPGRQPTESPGWLSWEPDAHLHPGSLARASEGGWCVARTSSQTLLCLC